MPIHTYVHTHTRVCMCAYVFQAQHPVTQSKQRGTRVLTAVHTWFCSPHTQRLLFGVTEGRSMLTSVVNLVFDDWQPSPLMDRNLYFPMGSKSNENPFGSKQSFLQKVLLMDSLLCSHHRGKERALRILTRSRHPAAAHEHVLRLTAA